MIFDGLSRKHALRLVAGDVEYYEKHKNSITKTLFKDSYICSRFTLLLVDCLQKIHTTYAYSLRSFYKNSQVLYANMTEIIDSTCPNLLESFNKVDACLISAYFEEVSSNIIIPLLKQYGLYSPNMHLMIFVMLYTSMMITYVHDDSVRDALIKTYKKYNQLYMNDADETFKLLNGTMWLPEYFQTMLKDEYNVWSGIHKRTSGHIQTTPSV